jgi:hypothetical protein
MKKERRTATQNREREKNCHTKLRKREELPHKIKKERRTATQNKEREKNCHTK